MGKIVSVFLCVNLDVDVQIYFYIFIGLKENKFGIDIDCVIIVFECVAELFNIKVIGIDCYIGF